jgi:hypothetical protein
MSLKLSKALADYATGTASWRQLHGPAVKNAGHCPFENRLLDQKLCENNAQGTGL